MKAPTDRQLEVLAFIQSWWDKHKLPPTYRDIAGGFGIAVRAAQQHVHFLIKKGGLQKMTQTGKRSKGLLVTEIGQRWLETSPTPSLVTAKHDIRSLLDQDKQLRERFAECKATGDTQGFLDWLEGHLS